MNRIVTRLCSHLLLVALVLGTLGQPAWAADEIRTERVHFAKGASSAVIEGTITGYETVDYVLAAAAGQYANISMATKNSANYFNILAPGESEVAFFNGSVSENQYEGTLPATGDYKIRVYMMRSAARRNEKANYRLEMIVTGKPSAAAPAAAASTSKGIDATGKLPCAQHKGQPMGQCDFAASRTANGGARVFVTHADGHKRTIIFTGGKATGADAGPDVPFSAQREADLNLVRVGDERYEVPDAVVWGG